VRESPYKKQLRRITGKRKFEEACRQKSKEWRGDESIWKKGVPFFDLTSLKLKRGEEASEESMHWPGKGKGKMTPDRQDHRKREGAGGGGEQFASIG